VLAGDAAFARFSRVALRDGNNALIIANGLILVPKRYLTVLPVSCADNV
jgi:hypothetical protein